MVACDLWCGLVNGRWSIVARGGDDDRGFLVAMRSKAPRPLTDGERRIATLAAMGRSNKVIADDLGVSIGSVSSQLSSALRKLGCSRSDLIILFCDA